MPVVKRLLAAFAAFWLLASAAVAQVQPGPQSLAYTRSQAMTVGTLYGVALGNSPFALPVRAIMINCTAPGNVAITLADGSVDVLQIPVGLFILPLQAVEVNSSGTTASATYWQEG